MNYNICSTCGAKDGRAGMLINGDCLNCHDTNKGNGVIIHSNLIRTDEEINKTINSLLNY